MRTLEQFLLSENRSACLAGMSEHVKQEGFRSFYVRRGPQFFDGETREKILVLANIVASRPGNGELTKFLKEFREKYHDMTIGVESVQSTRFESGLLRMGFRRDRYLSLNFILTPSDPFSPDGDPPIALSP